MSHGVDETYTLYSRETRRARKDHVCCACREVIKPGEIYVWVAVIYDGSAETYKRCPKCEHIFNRLVTELAERDEWPDEDLGCGHEWFENLGKPLPADLAHLAFMSHDDVQARAKELLSSPKPLENWIDA